MENDKKKLTEKIKLKALELGFSKIGITNADDFTEYAQEFESRIDDYKFLVGGKIDPLRGAYPKNVMSNAKSVIALVYDVSNIDYPKNLVDSIGRVYLSRSYLPLAKSAHGARLKLFTDFLIENGCNVTENLHMPERIACARAGVVTYGANNFAYTPESGSFIILRCLLIDKQLIYDKPSILRPCPQNCSKCIDACPTGALYAKGKLKPQKCLLFNQMNKHYNSEIRDYTGTSIHGCDLCQTACPRNSRVLNSPKYKDPFLEEISKVFDLEKVLFLDKEYYDKIIYPIMYNYITDLNFFRRNAAIALGNTCDKLHLPALKKALETSESPIVKDAAKWAIDKLSTY